MSSLVGGKTLQEIQEMPMSKRHAHMRRYVCKDWGRDIPAKTNEKKWDVDVTLISNENECFEVWASNEEEALEKAIKYINAEFCFDDYNIDNIKEAK